MGTEEQITQIVEQCVARVFQLDPAEVASHHELRFKEDLHATSQQYFPIIAAFEDKLDLYIDYHDFQFAAVTIQKAIDFTVEEYEKDQA